MKLIKDSETTRVCQLELFNVKERCTLNGKEMCEHCN
jgi:hypothetical protein